MQKEIVMSKNNSIERMQSVEQLIANKMMMVDAKNYQVAMLAELWNLYFDEGKIHLCQNIKNYCNIKNSYDKLPPNRNPTVLVSIKDAQGEVAPYAYYSEGKIQLIENAEAIRTFPKKMMKFTWKLMFRISLFILAIPLIILLLVYMF